MMSLNVKPSIRENEWSNYWPLVATAFVGLSLTNIIGYSTGLVIEPITAEFGWTRTEIMSGYMLAALLSIPLSPLVGALIDKYGVRRLSLPGIVMTCCAMAAIGLADGSVVQWLMLWGLYGLLALSVKATIWTAAVSGAFNSGRSMALSVALCGQAFSAIVGPPLMQMLTDSLGWREAYVVVAIIWGIPAFVLSFLFLYDARDRKRRDGTASRTAGVGTAPPSTPSGPDNLDLPGLSMKAALRCVTLWRIGAATLIMLLLGAGLMVHKVPLLTELGVERSNAALLASLSGVASVTGKLLTGWMMQRFNPEWIASATNAIMAIALIFLLEPFQSTTTIVLSMLIVGYASGTKLQICVYLTSVYAGMRNYGKIFGVMASLIAVASALGPMVVGIAYDLAGGYDAFILAGIPAALLCAGLMIGLGPYPEWSKAMETGSKRRAVSGLRGAED